MYSPASRSVINLRPSGRLTGSSNWRDQLIAAVSALCGDIRKVIEVREALEETKAHGVRFKAPKTKAGRRDITLPDLLVETLRELRKEQLEIRIKLGAGKLQDDALLFAGIDGALPSQKRSSKAW